MQSYPIFCFNTVSLREFVEFWSRAYDPTNEHFYSDHVRKSEFSEDDVVQLFVWKNGTVLSRAKMESLTNKIISKLDVINALKRSFDENTFEQHFASLTAIWKSFLQHTIAPNRFPIYDQHVFRAYHFLTTGVITEMEDHLEAIPISKLELVKYAFYLNRYVPFAQQLSQDGDLPLKKIDEALMAFGQFLKSKYAQILPIKPS